MTRLNPDRLAAAHKALRDGELAGRSRVDTSPAVTGQGSRAMELGSSAFAPWGEIPSRHGCERKVLAPPPPWPGVDRWSSMRRLPTRAAADAAMRGQRPTPAELVGIATGRVSGIVVVDVILELTLAWNRAHGRPPLPDDEVARVVQSSARVHERGSSASP
jgi:hypothetical protein